MIDCEPTYNSNGTLASAPQISDAVAFINQYRALGGTVYLLYLPHWYWQGNLGQASLSPVTDLGMLLVSSDYTGYSDTGPGWAAYGGMTPLIWQYTSTATLNGVSNVDMNAYQGTLADFQAQVSTGAQTGGNPILTEGDTGPAVTTLKTRLTVWGATLTVDGPGQGENAPRFAIRPDWSTVITPLLDHLIKSERELDLGRIGLMGISMGGIYGPRAAAREKRLCAIVALAGPYDLSECWSALNPLTKGGYVFYTKSRDEDEAFERSKALTLRGDEDMGTGVAFSLNRSRYGALAAQLGTMVVQDLISAAGERLEDPAGGPGEGLRHAAAHPLALVGIDEFSALGADHLVRLLARGRESGVSLLVATQEMADLERAAAGLSDQVLGNTFTNNASNVPYLFLQRNNSALVQGNSFTSTGSGAAGVEIWDSQNVQVTSNTMQLGVNGLGVVVESPDTATSATISGNQVNTNDLGVGVFTKKNTTSFNTSISVVNNDLSTNRVGLEVIGDGVQLGTTDAGGGGTSSGGNNFSTFTTTVCGRAAILTSNATTGTVSVVDRPSRITVTSLPAPSTSSVKPSTR